MSIKSVVLLVALPVAFIVTFLVAAVVDDRIGGIGSFSLSGVDTQFAATFAAGLVQVLLIAFVYDQSRGLWQQVQDQRRAQRNGLLADAAALGSNAIALYEGEELSLERALDRASDAGWTTSAIDDAIDAIIEARTRVEPFVQNAFAARTRVRAIFGDDSEYSAVTQLTRLISDQRTSLRELRDLLAAARVQVAGAGGQVADAPMRAALGGLRKYGTTERDAILALIDS